MHIRRSAHFWEEGCMPLSPSISEPQGVSQWVSQSLSDKVTYWAVCGQLKTYITQPFQFTIIPQVLPWYIQYVIFFKNLWFDDFSQDLTSMYFANWYFFHKLQCSFPNSVPVGHNETHQITIIPKVLAWYIYIYPLSTYIIYPNYFLKWKYPIPALKGSTETVQLTFISQEFAWYIQYQHI